MNNLEILSIGELLKLKLAIPYYQRPYRWTLESAGTLFNDLYSAFSEKLPEYRIGSIILHDEDGKLNIVDGQQRVTTISILVFCFSKLLNDIDKIENLSILKEEENYNELSINSIVNNYDLLIRKCEEIGDVNLIKNFRTYLLENCTVVKIITKSEQEAFQFFDSQNSRGKELAPQDLLKSYHLREMKNDNENEKLKIITEWENTDQKKLKSFFRFILYPLVRWYKNKSGLYYSVKKIQTFKGIKSNNNYNFSVYHKASNLYIEHFNKEAIFELTDGSYANQFQLTQPIIAGRRFFQYTLHYFKMYQEIKNRVEFMLKDNNFSEYLSGSGNFYVKNLFINISIFFVDKFNLEELTETRLKRFFDWAYSLRIVMYAVYQETVNNYVLGKGRVNEGFNLFEKINEMQLPQELDLISFEKIQETSCLDKHKKIWNFIFGEINGK